MLLVPVPVVPVQLRHLLRPHYEQVFGILLFSTPREIERTTDHGRPVNDDDLVMSNGVRRVYEGRNPRISQEIGRGVIRRPLAPVENRFYSHASLVSLEQCLRDGCRGKGVRLDENLGLGVVDLVNDRLGASSVGAEEDLCGDVVQDEIGGVAGAADGCQEDGQEE